MAPAVPVSQYRRTCCANPLFLTDANAAVTAWLADVLHQASLACSAWHGNVRCSDVVIWRHSDCWSLRPVLLLVMGLGFQTLLLSDASGPHDSDRSAG